MKVVMSYKNPDMDGVSCMYAYSELLNRTGDNASYFVWDNPKQEVDIVCDIFGIDISGLKEDELNENNKVVIVDLNGTVQMHKIIKIENIVEIIDYHGLSKNLHTYTKIERLQIDKLGAAATIVAERYKESGLIPSREATILLYYGIISNSINLKASITNKRDIEICSWLKSICKDISDDKVEEIFIRKSQIDDTNLRAEMECEIPNVFDEFKVTVAQLEVANLDEFLTKNKSKMIDILKQVKEEKDVNYIFINCIDILNGYVKILVADRESKEFVTKTFGYSFDNNNEVEIDKIVQRKDLTKILREKYNL